MSFELIMVLFRDGGHSIDEALRPSHYASGSKLKQWLRVTRIRGDMNVTINWILVPISQDNPTEL